MYCRKLKNGKWSCTADASPDPKTGKRRQVTRRGNTKKEAQQRTRERIKELDSGTLTELSFREVYEEWLRVYRSSVKPATVDGRVSTLKHFIENKGFGDIQIKRITTRDLQNYLIERQEEGLSTEYLNAIKVSLKLVFNYAVKMSMLKASPVTNLIVPKGTSPEGKRRYLEKDEVKSLLKYAAEHASLQHYVMLYCQLSTGMRVGEMIALQWDDIDFSEGTININKTLYKTPKVFKLVAPKTKGSYRRILIDDHLIKLLKQYKIYQNTVRLQRPSDWWEHDLVFSTLTKEPGRPLWSSNVANYFNRIYRAIGIDNEITGSHILRHTHITMLVEAGLDLRSIMDRVGHESSETTLEIYSHVTQKMREEGIAKVSSYLSDLRDNW